MKLLLVMLVFSILLFGCTNKENTTKTENQTNKTNGEFCGGIAGIKCPNGYVCKYNKQDVSDAAGECVPTNS